MGIIEHIGRSRQGRSASLAEDFSPISPNPPESPHDPPADEMCDLAHVFAVARVRHRGHFRSRRGFFAAVCLDDFECGVIRKGESPAEWVNRNRPAGTPRVAGAPCWAEEDELWCWEPAGWCVYVGQSKEGLLSVTWMPPKGCFRYVLSQWGQRIIDGEWDRAEE